MAPKPPGSLSSALLPIGAVALVAGCSGGSVNSGGAFVPASNGARAMTKVQITLNFAVKGASSGRQAQALSANVRQVGIRMVPSPAPAATTTEQVFVIPQPVPASTTLTVDSPIGADTMILGAYEPAPVCSPPPIIVQQGFSASRRATSRLRKTAVAQGPNPLPSLVPLNGSVQNVTIAANGANTLSINLAPVTFGGQLQVTSGSGYLVSNALQWSPLENLSAPAQNAMMAVTALDVCGSPLTGPIANTVAVSGPAGTVFAPAAVPVTSAVSTGTVGATYSAGANTGGSVTGAGTAPANTAPAYPPTAVSLVPDAYIFSIDPQGVYLSVYDAASSSQLGGSQVGPALSAARAPLTTRSGQGSRRALGFNTVGIRAMASVNASACTGGASAAAVALAGRVAGSPGGVAIVTVSPSGIVSPATFLAWQPTAAGVPQAVAFDSACRLYVGDDTGYLGVASLGGAFSVSQPVPQASGPAPISALMAGSSAMFVGYQDATPIAHVATFPFGATAPLTPTAFSSAGTTSCVDALALAGGNVYVASSFSNGGYFGNFQDALSGSSISGGQFPIGATGCPYVFQMAGSATSATLYALGYTSSQSGYFLTSSAASSPVMSVPGDGGQYGGLAVTPGSPTSMLWVSSSSNNIWGFTLPNLSTATNEIPQAGSGPLSIAP
jgi:hypothetical protein